MLIYFVYMQMVYRDRSLFSDNRYKMSHERHVKLTIMPLISICTFILGLHSNYAPVVQIFFLSLPVLHNDRISHKCWGSAV